MGGYIASEDGKTVEMMIQKTEKEKYARWAMHMMIFVYGLACLWLYYRQATADLSVGGEIPYQSDLPLHISMIIEDGWYYSFTAYAYKLLYLLFGGSRIGIALFLAIVSWATVYATETFVCYLQKGRTADWHTLLLAFTLNFVMPVYVRRFGEYRYVSYQSANIWHNSTYLCMRLVALVTLLVYFKLEKKYREGISIKEWMIFMLLNVLCTGIKPSFLLAFSPIMGIFLLVDLIKKVPLRRILVFGSALLPSGLVILWQNAVLFGQETGNGIGFHPWYTFALHAASAKPAVLCSVLFCLIVCGLTLKKLAKEKEYLFLVLMAVLGFLEALCLVENGRRSVDGNFLWGYSFCLSVLFTVCAVKWLEFGKMGWQRVVRWCLAPIYGWHLYCGLYFFINLVGGASYWMR